MLGLDLTALLHRVHTGEDYLATPRLSGDAARTDRRGRRAGRRASHRQRTGATHTSCRLPFAFRRKSYPFRFVKLTSFSGMR